MRLLLTLTSALGTLLLTHCGTPSLPSCHSVPKASRTDPTTELDTARQAWLQLGSTDPSTRQSAITTYNASVSRLFDQLNCSSGSFLENAAARGMTAETYHLLHSNLQLTDLDGIIRADRVSVKDVGQRYTRAGLGLPVVGWKKTASKGELRWDFAPPTGVPLNLTALLDFPPAKPPRWVFIHPGQHPSYPTPGPDPILAADWSAPGALYWSMSEIDDFDVAKVLLPSRFSEETCLYVVNPYDPKKIPLVLVHGLKSSPGTFKKLFNQLHRETWFRENYQVWFFSYPTGNNWLYSAARFRQAMAEATRYVKSKGPSPYWDDMVVAGHSMGGVITHASLKKPESELYEAFAIKPIDQLKVNRQTREAIRLLTLYQPLQPPSRAIFMAAPHQGSPFADRTISELATHLIRLPKQLSIDLIDFTIADLASLATQDGYPSKGWFTSIGSLSPSYPAYKVLRQSKFRSNLRYHSIIGDRGRCDTPDSSDGIVPYWSAHLPKADSEKIVPCGHSVPAAPETAEEFKRILLLHLKEVRPASHP